MPDDVVVARARCPARALALTATITARGARATIEVAREARSRRVAFARGLAVATLTRVALALTRARARDAWLASAMACAMATRAMGRARAVARATMDRALGARCADGTAVPREDARGFEVAERLSATDAWYQVVCARGGGRGRVDVLGGTRCSGEMARVVMATARRCFEDG
jgi:hypothetical protein|tara:strand:- start:6 stop:518 length:513 start_codon:yes stop_codon:yes gene_type:complete